MPKLVDAKIIGSAYALIFWIQNIGLWLFPMLIGKVLDSGNPEITQALADGTMTQEVASVSYNYTAPLVMLAGFSMPPPLCLALCSRLLTARRILGLSLPNVISRVG